MDDVIIRIKRPEGYEDVSPELVLADFVETVGTAVPPWQYEVVTDLKTLN